MKVTFTCEKCGHEVFVSSWVRARDGDMLMQTPPNTECPNCAKLTYGPLTEEMVAEALWSAQPYGSDVVPWGDVIGNRGGVWSGNIKDTIAQARFVLRLLNTVDPNTTFFDPEADQRRWLLSLARGL